MTFYKAVQLIHLQAITSHVDSQSRKFCYVFKELLLYFSDYLRGKSLF